jgi:hypothetical protein
MTRTRNLKRKTYKRKSSKRRVSRKKASRKMKRGGASFNTGTKLKCCLVSHTSNKDPTECLPNFRDEPNISRSVTGEVSNISDDGLVTLNNSKFYAKKYTEMYPDKMVTVDQSTCVDYLPILKSDVRRNFKYYLEDEIREEFKRNNVPSKDNDVVKVFLNITNTRSTESPSIYSNRLESYVQNNQIPEQVITSLSNEPFRDFMHNNTDPIFLDLKQIIVDKTGERADLIRQQEAQKEQERLAAEQREKAKFSNRFKSALGFR